jgi:serine/threonine-protein kinase HipA
MHGAPIAAPGYEHWIVKFRGKDDPRDIGPIEQAYALMARDAGLDVPDTVLLPGSGKEPGYFAARRFGPGEFQRTLASIAPRRRPS